MPVRLTARARSNGTVATVVHAGPLLVFITTLYQLCQRMGIPFLPTYAWVSLWTAALVMVCAVTDASFLMRYFTRFTDEIFAALISMIFIYEAVWALMRESRGLSDSPDPSSQNGLPARDGGTTRSFTSARLGSRGWPSTSGSVSRCSPFRC